MSILKSIARYLDFQICIIHINKNTEFQQNSRNDKNQRCILKQSKTVV